MLFHIENYVEHSTKIIRNRAELQTMGQ